MADEPKYFGPGSPETVKPPRKLSTTPIEILGALSLLAGFLFACGAFFAVNPAHVIAFSIFAVAGGLAFVICYIAQFALFWFDNRLPPP